MVKYMLQHLTHSYMLIALLLINIAGTIYGYIWYGSQLAITPLKFLLFVPDSPTASLFFVFVLIAFLLKQNWPIIEALALLTLFKYGIWAVVMNVLVLIEVGHLPWEGYMLIGSHFLMAVQGILYAPFYRVKLVHLVIAAIWTLHNDVIDYVFGMMPSYRILSEYTAQIGYFTFWLSVTAIAITYIFGVNNQRFRIEFLHR